MRHRPGGGLDLITAALIGGGALLIAASIVVAIVLLVPPDLVGPTLLGPAPTPTDVVGRTAVMLPPDRVAAVLNVDAAAGAGVAARSGDHVDVLGYFSRQVTGAESVTRVLLRDVPVVTVDRSAANVALTLAVPQTQALLLQEAQALGARPFVMLRPDVAQPAAVAEAPASFSDVDLANRLTGTH
jgi:Flp pilus assembly protein RcpC/CpaB